MKKIRTFFSGVALSAERPVGLSKTVPDMTLSLQELVRRYTRTGAFGDVATFQSVYNGEAEVPPIERMTPQERLEFSRAVKEHIDELLSIRRAAPPVPPVEAPKEQIPEQNEEEQQ